MLAAGAAPSDLPGFGRAVALRVLVEFLPLRAERERVEAARPVHGEDPVQVVDLVLQQFRHRAVELHRVLLLFQVGIRQRRPVRTCHSHEQVWERETVVPHEEVLRPHVGDLGVDHRPALLVDLHEHDAHGRADLGGRERPAHSVLSLCGAERVPQVVRDEPRRGGLGVVDPLAAGPQHGIAQLANAADCHGAPIWGFATALQPAVTYRPLMSLAGLVLAAGRSERMGTPKALLDFRGQPFVIRILEALEALEVRPRLAVLVPDAPRTRPTLAAHDCVVVENADVAGGSIASLRVALRALQTVRPSGLLVWPVDLPHVRVATVERLIEAYRRTAAVAVVPTFGERRGHPVIWDQQLFAELESSNDATRHGARAGLHAHEDRIRSGAADDAAG